MDPSVLAAIEALRALISTEAAIDIKQARGISIQKMAELAATIPALASGGIGVYDWGIHIDVRGYKARW
jgi:hypothetical protein